MKGMSINNNNIMNRIFKYVMILPPHGKDYLHLGEVCLGVPPSRKGCLSHDRPHPWVH